MKPSAIDDVLRIHVDDSGVVWCGTLGILSLRTGLSVGQFILSEVFRDTLRIRLLGCAANAPLICAIHNHQIKHGRHGIKDSIRICSPAMFTRRQLQEPTIVLQRLWQPTSEILQASSFELQIHDVCAYQLLAQLQGEQYWHVTSTVLQTAQMHPGWAAASFPFTSDVEAVARLLGHIVDPRWFLHPTRPNRLTRLYQYFGLSPKNCDNVLKAQRPHRMPEDRWARLQNAVKAWTGGKTPEEIDYTQTNNHLWRIYRSRGGGKGLHNATCHYLRMIALSWLQLLVRPVRTIFLPSMMLDSEEEIAYRRHAACFYKG